MISANSGESIYHAAQRAIFSCQNRGTNDTLIFNGIHLSVSQYSHDSDIAEIYYLKSKIRQLEGK